MCVHEPAMEVAVFNGPPTTLEATPGSQRSFQQCVVQEPTLQQFNIWSPFRSHLCLGALFSYYAYRTVISPVVALMSLCTTITRETRGEKHKNGL